MQKIIICYFLNELLIIESMCVWWLLLLLDIYNIVHLLSSGAGSRTLARQFSIHWAITLGNCQVCRHCAHRPDPPDPLPGQHRGVQPTRRHPSHGQHQPGELRPSSWPTSARWSKTREVTTGLFFSHCVIRFIEPKTHMPYCTMSPFSLA